MNNEFIYALCLVGGAPFYVGRTNNMERRLREHNYDKRFGHETKYQVIRELERVGEKWEMVLLEEVGPDTEHYEDFWVYTLLLEGYELANMKQGDAKQKASEDAMRSMLKRKERYSDAKTFLSAREREEKEAAARAATARLKAKVRKERVDTFDAYSPSQALFVWDLPKTMKTAFQSPWMKARLERLNNQRSKKR